MQVSFSSGGLVVTAASGFFVLRSREEKATLKPEYEQVYAAASQMYATSRDVPVILDATLIKLSKLCPSHSALLT